MKRFYIVTICSGLLLCAGAASIFAKNLPSENERLVSLYEQLIEDRQVEWQNQTDAIEYATKRRTAIEQEAQAFRDTIKVLKSDFSQTQNQ